MRQAKSLFNSVPVLASVPTNILRIVRTHKFSVPSRSLSQSTIHSDMSLPPTLMTSGGYDSSYSSAVRKFNRTYGMLPPAVETLDTQLARCQKRLERKERPIDKYMYLSRLRNSDVHLFYRFVTRQIKEIAPLIYTPTVGDACLL